MATGNMLLGTLRNKLGDVVFYRQGGKQRSRPRVVPSNPRSAKQCVQRMILATAAKMASAYKPIINHSFEGVAVGEVSVRHFRALAMARLRQAAAQAFDDNVNIVADFAVKGAPVVGAVDGLKISTGSLSFPATSQSETGLLQLDVPDGFAAALTKDNYTSELAKLGVQPGDQITVVTQFINVNSPVGSVNDEDQNFAQAVRYGRITFKTSLQADLQLGLFTADGRLNEAVVDKYEGAIGITFSEGKVTFMVASPAGYPMVQCSAIIRSKKNDNGTFSYSNATMQTTYDTFDWNNAADVWPSYSGLGVAVNVGDELYLRNAVASK